MKHKFINRKAAKQVKLVSELAASYLEGKAAAVRAVAQAERDRRIAIALGLAPAPRPVPSYAVGRATGAGVRGSEWWWWG
jgi:hypothetical protein